MKLSENVKPISYLKAQAPEVIRRVAEQREPVVITVHGEAKAVLQDLESYEQIQETLALLKILAVTNKRVEDGRSSPAAEAFVRVRRRVQD